MKKSLLLLFIGILTLQSCASKKDILYFQDIDQVPTTVNYTHSLIQINDILSIRVSTLVPEAAIPYNTTQNTTGGGGSFNADILRLNGYLVSDDVTLTFPILGIFVVSG
jgi:polysaccharide export outer membrane protein